MSDKEKLEWLLRLIVTAGGPEQRPDEPDYRYRIRMTMWILDREPCESGIRKDTD